MVTTVVNSVYLFTISLLCQATLLSSETISSSQLGWLLWGGEKRGKALRKTLLKKMGGREMDTFLQLSTHLLLLTPHKTVFFVPFYLLLWPMSLGAAPEIFLNRSMWFFISHSLFSTICCFFSLQQPYYPAHPTSLFWSDILTGTSLFQPAALGPGGLCLLQDSVGYGSSCSSSHKRKADVLTFFLLSSAFLSPFNGWTQIYFWFFFFFALRGVKEIIHYWF